MDLSTVQSVPVSRENTLSRCLTYITQQTKKHIGLKLSFSVKITKKSLHYTNFPQLTTQNHTHCECK